jgi:hypothetical protein
VRTTQQHNTTHNTTPQHNKNSYPRNAKLLRSYGRFLEGVKNDPWGAARYYEAADRAAESSGGGGGGEGGGGEGGAEVRGECVCVCVLAAGVV